MRYHGNTINALGGAGSQPRHSDAIPRASRACRTRLLAMPLATDGPARERLVSRSAGAP
ncbi:hypothetical protein GCM10009731_30850 [Streptomyces globosus]